MYPSKFRARAPVTLSQKWGKGDLELLAAVPLIASEKSFKDKNALKLFVSLILPQILMGRLYDAPQTQSVLTRLICKNGNKHTMSKKTISQCLLPMASPKVFQ